MSDAIQADPTLQDAERRLRQRKRDYQAETGEQPGSGRAVPGEEPQADSPGLDDAAELDPNDPFNTRVPEGEYVVQFVEDREGFAYNQPRHFLCFEIFEPEEHRGRRLYRFINTPDQWKGKRRGAKARALGRSSHLWQDFVAITGRVPPIRKFALSDLYKHAMHRVQVVDVKRTSSGGEHIEVPEAARYSKIARFLRTEAGPHTSRLGQSRTST